MSETAYNIYIIVLKGEFDEEGCYGGLVYMLPYGCTYGIGSRRTGQNGENRICRSRCGRRGSARRAGSEKICDDEDCGTPRRFAERSGSRYFE